MSADPLYEFSEWAILVVLLGLVLGAGEVGYRLGRSRRLSAPELVRSHVIAIQAALLGLFALVLGFTFGMSLSRYEGRKHTVVREANAIAVVALRARLVAPGPRAEIQNLLRRYLAVRLSSAHHTNAAEHRELDREAAALQERLWRQASAALAAEAGSNLAGPLLSAVGDLIVAKRESDAALANHVPESVSLLLFVFAVLATGMIGYSNSLTGTRIQGATVTFATLVVLLIVVIVDLDRPFRGLIRVRQDSIVSLQQVLAPQE